MTHTVIITNYWNAYYKILLFNALRASGEDFHVIYCAESEKIREWKLSKQMLEFPYEILFPTSLDDIGAISIILRTWRKLNTLKPAVVITDGYSLASSWSALLWTTLNRKKLVLWSSSNYYDHKRSFLREWIKRLFVRRCSAYTVYGTNSRDYLIKLGAHPDKIEMMGNNTDNTFFSSETAKHRNSRTELLQAHGLPNKNILFVGRFSSEKNLLYLLDGFKDAFKNSGDWGLILVGSGPLQEMIESHIIQQEIKHVYLAGFQQMKDLPRYLAMSDILVLPSISETWGVVVNEAMAASLPVLVSKQCGCYPDLVQPGRNGFAFDPENLSELTSLLKMLSVNSLNLEAMGKQSAEIVSNYTPQRAAAAVIETIKTATA